MIATGHTKLTNLNDLNAAQRARGPAKVFTQIVDLSDLDSVHELRTPIDAPPGALQTPSRTLGLFGPKGGVGCTTLACNVGGALVRRGFEAAVVGQNLLDSHHLEFFGAGTPATEVDRGVYATVTWRR